jgi:aspartyl-tRNA(Asn)/glutamyl-tRNA(Gln) amidotransferase subunit C
MNDELNFAHSAFSVHRSKMPISREEVEKVSLLGRLLLSDAELDTMTHQLGDILAYMELLGEVDTRGVEPMAHALDVANAFRDDSVRPSLERESALANAPHRDAECYLVPAVLGET